MNNRKLKYAGFAVLLWVAVLASQHSWTVLLSSDSQRRHKAAVRQYYLRQRRHAALQQLPKSRQEEDTHEEHEPVRVDPVVVAGHVTHLARAAVQGGVSAVLTRPFEQWRAAYDTRAQQLRERNEHPSIAAASLTTCLEEMKRSGGEVHTRHRHEVLPSAFAESLGGWRRVPLDQPCRPPSHEDYEAFCEAAEGDEVVADGEASCVTPLRLDIPATLLQHIVPDAGTDEALLAELLPTGTAGAVLAVACAHTSLLWAAAACHRMASVSCSVASLVHSLHMTSPRVEAHNTFAMPLTLKPYDVVLLPGVVGCVGLGTWGDPVAPSADLALLAVAACRVRDALVFTLHVGSPRVVWNTHRVYGADRLSALISTFAPREVVAAVLLGGQLAVVRGVPAVLGLPAQCEESPQGTCLVAVLLRK